MLSDNVTCYLYKKLNNVKFYFVNIGEELLSTPMR